MNANQETFIAEYSACCNKKIYKLKLINEHVLIQNEKKLK